MAFIFFFVTEWLIHLHPPHQTVLFHITLGTPLKYTDMHYHRIFSPAFDGLKIKDVPHQYKAVNLMFKFLSHSHQRIRL